jgi:hypothetical protein
MHQFHKFILSWKSTRFGKFVCPSSGVYSLYTQQWHMSYRFVDSCRAGVHRRMRQQNIALKFYYTGWAKCRYTVMIFFFIGIVTIWEEPSLLYYILYTYFCLPCISCETCYYLYSNGMERSVCVCVCDSLRSNAPVNICTGYTLRILIHHYAVYTSTYGIITFFECLRRKSWDISSILQMAFDEILKCKLNFLRQLWTCLKGTLRYC